MVRGGSSPTKRTTFNSSRQSLPLGNDKLCTFSIPPSMSYPPLLSSFLPMLQQNHMEIPLRVAKDCHSWASFGRIWLFEIKYLTHPIKKNLRFTMLSLHVFTWLSGTWLRMDMVGSSIQTFGVCIWFLLQG